MQMREPPQDWEVATSTTEETWMLRPPSQITLEVLVIPEHLATHAIQNIAFAMTRFSCINSIIACSDSKFWF